MRLLVCVCALVLLPVRVYAQDDSRAFLDMTVNGVEAGDHLVVLRGTDVLIAVATLNGAGVQGFAGTRETIGGDEFVSLVSLRPRLTYALDERDLRLTLTVDPDWLARVTHDLQGLPPPDIQYRGTPSAFVNYALTGGSGGDYEVFTESALSARGALFYNTVSATGRRTTRGLTNMTIDRRSSLRRWVVGDSFAGGGALGGDALVGGVTVSREFSLAPYFVRYPTLSMSAAVPTPSVVEVYVNGRLVRQENMLPGRLDVRNLPLNTGRNDTRIVVRDPFGGTREVITGYYLTSAVLARGIHDYQYSGGWRRSGFGTESFQYSAPVMLARHRIGVTDSVTLGGRVEADRERVSAGPTLNLRLPVGDLQAAFGGSRAGRRTGTAAEITYIYSGRTTSVGGSVRQQTEWYANLSQAPFDPRPRTEASLFGSVPLGRLASMTVQHARAFGSRDIAQRRTSALASARLSRWADAVASFTRTSSLLSASREVTVGLTVTFGRSAVGSASAVRDNEGTRGVVDVQRPLPIGTGFGYQLHSESGVRDAVSGVLQYQGEFGRYEVRREAVGGGQHSTVSVSGAVAAIGGGVYATRAIRNSFALVRVPDVAAVRTYASNQEIGRTNRRGNLLIPDLLPYYGNRLNISDTDVPLDYEVPQVGVTLAPPYRGGAVILFPVHRVQRSSGSVTISIDGKDQVPGYGELTVNAGGRQLVSPLGAAGEFYFEDLPAGRHRADVVYHGLSCSFTLEVPVSQDAALSLGRSRCSEPAALPQ